EDVATIGDSLNDRSMLQMAGHSYAMDNASPEVKAMAKFIAPSHREDGVAVVIEEILNQLYIFDKQYNTRYIACFLLKERIIVPDSKDTIYYQEGPRCVLLLHGFVGSIQEIGRTARALRKAGYSVYAFNLAGHGTKPVGDLFEVHPNEWIQQVDEAIQFLEDEGYEQIAIMGLSLGGILALNAAQKYPNHFTGIGAFNSPCINGLDPTPIRRYITSSIRRILSHRKWYDEDIQQEVESLTPLMNQQIEQIDELIIGVRDNLPKVTTPTYIAKSIQD